MKVEKNIIVAVADNLAIGRGGELLWHISEDLKYFKAVTMGCPVIMGRKTFESLRRPLPGRLNVVVTRNAEAVLPEGVVTANSLETAISLASEAVLEKSSLTAPLAGGKTAAGISPPQSDTEAGENSDAAGECEGKIFIIGGGEIYRQAMPLADKLYVTAVHTVPQDADTYFPVIDGEKWFLASRSGISHDPASGLDYEFLVYSRR